MKFHLAVLTIGLLIAGAGTVHAEMIYVPNFSFESPALTNNDYQGDGTYPAPFTIPGWTTDPSGGDGVQNFGNPSSFGGGATLSAPGDGLQTVYINGTGGPSGSGYVFQDVGALLPDTTYTLTVAAGNQSGYGPGSVGAIELINGTDAGGTVLSSTVVGSASDPNSLVGAFTDFTTSFTTGNTVSSDLTIALLRTSSGNGKGDQLLYDNVRLSAVPEPSSVFLATLAALGVVAATRRRRKV